MPLIAFAVWYSEESGPPIVRGALAFFTTMALLPCLFVYGMYRAGYVSNPSLPKRTERLQPAIFALVCAMVAYPILRSIGAAQVFVQLDAGLLKVPPCADSSFLTISSIGTLLAICSCSQL